METSLSERKSSMQSRSSLVESKHVSHVRSNAAIKNKGNIPDTIDSFKLEPPKMSRRASVSSHLLPFNHVSHGPQFAHKMSSMNFASSLSSIRLKQPSKSYQTFEPSSITEYKRLRYITNRDLHHRQSIEPVHELGVKSGYHDKHCAFASVTGITIQLKLGQRRPVEPGEARLTWTHLRGRERVPRYTSSTFHYRMSQAMLDLSQSRKPLAIGLSSFMSEGRRSKEKLTEKSQLERKKSLEQQAKTLDKRFGSSDWMEPVEPKLSFVWGEMGLNLKPLSATSSSLYEVLMDGHKAADHRITMEEKKNLAKKDELDEQNKFKKKPYQSPDEPLSSGSSPEKFPEYEKVSHVKKSLSEELSEKVSQTDEEAAIPTKLSLKSTKSHSSDKMNEEERAGKMSLEESSQYADQKITTPECSDHQLILTSSIESAKEITVSISDDAFENPHDGAKTGNIHIANYGDPLKDEGPHICPEKDLPMHKISASHSQTDSSIKITEKSASLPEQELHNKPQTETDMCRISSKEGQQDSGEVAPDYRDLLERPPPDYESIDPSRSPSINKTKIHAGMAQHDKSKAQFNISPGNKYRKLLWTPTDYKPPKLSDTPPKAMLDEPSRSPKMPWTPSVYKSPKLSQTPPKAMLDEPAGSPGLLWTPSPFRSPLSPKTPPKTPLDEPKAKLDHQQEILSRTSSEKSFESMTETSSEELNIEPNTPSDKSKISSDILESPPRSLLELTQFQFETSSSLSELKARNSPEGLELQFQSPIDTSKISLEQKFAFVAENGTLAEESKSQHDYLEEDWEEGFYDCLSMEGSSPRTTTKGKKRFVSRLATGMRQTIGWFFSRFSRKTRSTEEKDREFYSDEEITSANNDTTYLSPKSMSSYGSDSNLNSSSRLQFWKLSCDLRQAKSELECLRAENRRLKVKFTPMLKL
ncbi:hypothetical protein PoB_005266600 [Plakobranchus ocellatus]|uniref:Uncharacterized protein n=1 Tax=Plakobranchus ocellatus TaxID=259542 RepID=A0AAV4C447_9GAST|nr:hypothetical protein PoB_005266600 [Plakobranchus ocellatus]